MSKTKSAKPKTTKRKVRLDGIEFDDADALVVSALASGLRPDARLSVSEWADAFPRFVVDRYGRARQVAHRAHAVPCRHYGCADRRFAVSKSRFNERRTGRRVRNGRQLFGVYYGRIARPRVISHADT